MTRIAALLFVLVMVITSNAQHTNFITRNAENGGVEEYYVLDVDSKSKHGTYVRFYTPVFGGGYAIVESGNYQHGQ
jgi:hypothetical protein